MVEYFAGDEFHRWWSKWSLFQ